MHSVVLDVLPVQATLITEILFKLLVNVVSDGLPAGKSNSIKTKSSVLSPNYCEIKDKKEGSSALLTTQCC